MLLTTELDKLSGTDWQLFFAQSNELIGKCHGVPPPWQPYGNRRGAFYMRPSTAAGLAGGYGIRPYGFSEIF